MQSSKETFVVIQVISIILFCNFCKQKVEICPGVAQAATQTTPENERVSFVPNSKIKPKLILKNRSNSKNALKTDSVSSPESKDQTELKIQEPK